MTATLPPRRDWTQARAKVDTEGRCRNCRRQGGPGTSLFLEAAHVIGREHDQPSLHDERVLWVAPIDVVPLCRMCHALYDDRRLDLLPVLTVEEQAAAVRKVGIVSATRRMCGGGVAMGGRVP